MTHVKSAVFYTYAGKKIPVDFLVPMPKFERSLTYTMEKLADKMFAQTKKCKDPIVSYISLTLI